MHPERQLSGAICLAALLSDGVATYAAHPNGTGRDAGVVRVSTDNAGSWRDHVSFGDARAPFAYSGLTSLPADQGGVLGVVWETGMKSGCGGPSCRAVFSVFPKVRGEGGRERAAAAAKTDDPAHRPAGAAPAGDWVAATRSNHTAAGTTLRTDQACA